MAELSDVEALSGVLLELDENEYHGYTDALSSSGARQILPPSCPAEFRWKQEHREEKPYFDEGHAAHKLVLGIGMPIVEIPFKSWQFKDAKLQRDACYERNEIPLLTKQKRMVEDMAEALQRHPLARELLHPKVGIPEASLFCEDTAGCTLRARPDFATFEWDILVDYKTSTTAQPEAFEKAVKNYGYHMQDDFYRQVVIALGLHPNPDFLFVVQSKEPPYTVSVIRLDEGTRSIGYSMNRAAIELFASCQRTEHWPGWGNRIHTVGLNHWDAQRQADLLDQLATTGGF